MSTTPCDRPNAAEASGATPEAPVVDDAHAAALDLLPDAAMLVDAAGTVAVANDIASRLLGADRDALVGRDVEEVLVLTDEADNDWWACMRPLSGDPHIGQRLTERDLTLHTIAGRQRPVTVTARRIAGDTGVAAVAICIRPAEQRRRLDAARSDLVSTVSHELRSPLTSVKGFTKTLLAKWDRFSDEQKRQMLETVNEDADRVTRLLGELLDVSRIDAGRLQLARRMVELPSVVSKVLEGFRVRSDRDYIDEFDADLPAVYADPDKLAQVLNNLVENATNYGRGTVTVTATTDGSHLRCTVSDVGGEIHASNLSSIFTKFYRRPGERHAGTGLGLYISKGIIEAHGGKIWAESEPDVATRFHFTLPLGGLELAGITDETRRVLTERR